MKALFVTLMTLTGVAAGANEIHYLSSNSGFMLYRASNNVAVTANWSGQQPVTRFTGYGAIQMDNLCLTGRNGRQPLTWERCAGRDPNQIWAYRNGQLNNEAGWCADVEGNRRGASVRVLAWQCSGAVNQRWNAHYAVSAQAQVSRIQNPETRKAVEDFLRNSRPGQVLTLTPQQAKEVPKELISAGGLGLVSAGNGRLISAGGLGFNRR